MKRCHLWRCFLALFVVSLSVCGWGNPSQHVATAALADQSEDAVVINEVIKKQQQQPSTSSVNKQPDVVQTKVQSDLQEGELRTLPTLNQPVIDQAGLLNATQRQQISSQVRLLNDQAKAQIGVVIVSTTGQEDIFDYAMRVAEKWQLGAKKRDNGIVIALAVNDRRIQILTGYGLEGIFPDAVVSEIIRNQITPYFKQGQFAQGLESGISEIQKILNQDSETAQLAAKQLKEQQERAYRQQKAQEQMFTYTMFIIVAGVFASYIFGNRLTASVAGVATFTAGIVSGAGFLLGLLAGIGVFFLLITTLAQLILQLVLSNLGRGGGGGGNNSSGGGYSGGGGSFGGGGASGSW